MTTPYTGLPGRQFWSTGVRPFTSSDVEGIYTPKWPIAGLRIATAGSCFAQEISKALKARKFDVIDVEPTPYGVPPKVAARYGYGLYSARHGNIYTSSHLLQLTKEALGQITIPPDIYVIEHEGRYYDALRPTVEPEGLPNLDEVIEQRYNHLASFKLLLETCDLFIFTLGLTEGWFHRSTGTAYQSTPGVSAGVFDHSQHMFKNLRFNEIMRDMLEFRKLLKKTNPTAKMLLTVSPVPLVATAVERHVLVSTVRSKSVLRAVAGELAETLSDVDYFPSYELLSTPFLGKPLFEENKRSVTKDGVQTVMRAFFQAHDANTLSDQPKNEPVKTEEELVCEDALLEAFAPQ